MRCLRQSMTCLTTSSLRGGPKSLLRWKMSGVYEEANVLNIPARYCATTVVNTANHRRKKAKTDLVLNLTEDQEKMALDLLNNRSVRALSLTKGIGPEAAKLINNHRKENGPLQSLNDLKNIRGLKATRLLNRVQSQEGNLFLLMKYHYPLLDLFTEEERKRFKNVVSIDISYDKLTVANVGRNLEILDWKFIRIKRSSPLCPIQFAKQVKDTFISFPQADAYLVDRREVVKMIPPPQHSYARLQGCIVDMNVVESMLHAYGLKYGKIVLSIFPSEVNNYFNVKSGERYSASLKLFEQHLEERNSALALESFADLDYLSGESILKRVKLTDADFEIYQSRSFRLEKIAMADCLLQALYFLNYAVFMKRIV